MVKKTLEQQYQKLSQREHILLRPDTYIGSIQTEEAELYVFDDKNNKIVLKQINYCPGLYKIYDEIIVNAIDHVVRTRNEKDISLHTTKIDVEIDNNVISIKNNGKSIPIEIHKEYNKYIPDLIFGELLTSENYDDSEQRITGGKNGLGSKLVSIYSKTFTIEVGNNGKKYKRTYSENMTIKSKEKITDYSGKDYVKITFEPDYERFGCKELSKDMLSLFTKRVYDISATTPKDVKVTLNKENIKIKSFEDYVSMYLGETKKIYKQFNDRWEIVVCGSEDKFQQVSFVNGICTFQGGKHVDYISQQLVDGLYPLLTKKNKDLTIKKPFIKNYLFVFVKCNIVNPDFNSQTKEQLKTNKSRFGSSCELDKTFLDKVMKLDVMEEIVRFAMFKENKEIKKQDGKQRKKILDVPKYVGARFAGTKDNEKCTLILTEGDSASTLAMAGLSSIPKEQSDYFGLFPLKGKGINVRDISLKRLMENDEISNLKKIMGLEHGKDYKDLSSLRYGKIMMMCDQDHDGSHIKGLLFNVFSVLWPSLFKFPNFLESFLTPIVKATKGNQVVSFYNLHNYEQWKKDKKGWAIKYYKGLGTSTQKDAKEYFKNLTKNRISYTHTDKTDQCFDLAFNKKKADERKEWLMNYRPENVLEFNGTPIPLNDFIHKDLIHFSNDDLSRSIPSLVDGLKTSHRKVLFTALKRNITKEIKVAQLAGAVSEMSAYHHGEKSLEDCIVGMAQDYVGSNNINLLVPNGMFGSRVGMGKDSASSRYIFTQLSPETTKIFNKLDLPLLDYINDDGLMVEPKWYIPTLPMILINGAKGIGTGFSTDIPCYNPDDIKKNIQLLMKNKPMEDMIPWYRGFRGSIKKVDEYTYETIGLYEIDDNKKKIIITELPIGVGTLSYGEFLSEMSCGIDKIHGKEISKGKLLKQCIKNFEIAKETEKVYIEIYFDSKNFEHVKKDVIGTLKLSSYLKTSNMHLFNRNGIITKYKTTNDILKEYYDIRLEFYQKRKDFVLKQMNDEIKYMTAKIKFIQAVNLKKISMRKQTENEVLEYLANENYPLKDDSYMYLLNMPMRFMTKDQMKKLQDDIDKRTNEINELTNKTIKDLWNEDLN